jgi:hypothetical protein
MRGVGDKVLTRDSEKNQGGTTSKPRPCRSILDCIGVQRRGFFITKNVTIDIVEGTYEILKTTVSHKQNSKQ